MFLRDLHDLVLLDSLDVLVAFQSGDGVLVVLNTVVVSY